MKTISNIDDFFSSAEAIVAPNDKEQLIRWLQLRRSPRVGNQTFFKLLNKYKTPEQALLSLPETAQKAGVADYRPASYQSAEREYQAGISMGARLLFFGGKGFPRGFKDLSNPPALIWFLGNAEILEKPMIALVGARNASSLGRRIAGKIATDLGNAGFCVVSGLARGIDAAAHEGALSKGTLAVMASGINRIYPVENSALARDICKTGGLISEAPLGHAPSARHFPARNRLIAALSQGLAVVEAAAKSGSLMTAEQALELGRDVFAVPGHPFDARSFGTNNLIRDGCPLIRSAADILEGLTSIHQSAAARVSHKEAKEAKEAEPIVPALDIKQADLDARILEHLSASPISENLLLRDIGQPTEIVTRRLLELELNGQIARQSGGFLTRIV